LSDLRGLGSAAFAYDVPSLTLATRATLFDVEAIIFSGSFETVEAFEDAGDADAAGC